MNDYTVTYDVQVLADSPGDAVVKVAQALDDAALIPLWPVQVTTADGTVFDGMKLPG